MVKHDHAAGDMAKNDHAGIDNTAAWSEVTALETGQK